MQLLNSFWASVAAVLLCATAFAQSAPDSTLWTDSIIAASANPTPAKQVDNLTAINAQNPNLVWKTIDGVRYLKVVTYKSTKGATWYKNDQSGTYNTQQWAIWVTVAPSVQQYCGKLTNLSTAEKDARLEAYLGLQPKSGHTTWVELWVKEEDLFRPCPDNEISDSTCDLCLPENVPDWYRKWFNETRANQYGGQPANGYVGYPWTQLGYTYDWWPEASTIVGASEFVIKPHSIVIVGDKQLTEAYCKETK